MLNSLKALSPLDGRYQNKTEEIAKYFSEEILIKHRIKIETKYLEALAQSGIIRKLTEAEKTILYSLAHEDLNEVKEIEKTTNHDVKACEYFIKQRLEKTSLKDIVLPLERITYYGNL